MFEIVSANWPVFAALLVLALLALVWVVLGNRKTRIEREADAPEATSAKRNQALIDAPPAARAPKPASEPLPPPALNLPEVAPPPPAAPPAPESEAPPAASPSEQGSGDDLTRIKGVGPKLVAQLHTLGVSSFAQIAAWDEAEIDRIDAQLGRFQGRIRRDRWVEQAQLLAQGDVAGFEQEFGRT